MVSLNGSPFRLRLSRWTRLDCALLLAASLLFISGCQLSYYVKGAYHQSKILSNRQTLEHILSRPDIPDEVKRKINLTQEVKTFLENDLGLKKTKNYTSYVQLDREYVSWIVQAAPQLSIEPYLWRYPIVGALPYKGFFSEQEALDEAKDLEQQFRLDTYVRGVSAFSSLGWLRDPLLSSMMNYRDHELVELIIHESVHATLYIKSEAEFNESLATFIGLKGAELFYEKRGLSGKVFAQLIRHEIADRKLFSDFMNRQSASLAQSYLKLQSKGFSDQEALKHKKLVLSQIQKRFKNEVEARLKTDLFTSFGDSQLNNAKWIALQTYSKDISAFEKLYRALNSQMGLFLKKVMTLESSKQPAEDLVKITETFKES